MSLPKTLSLFGLDLPVSSSSLTGVTWSTSIGPIRVQVRTLRGQWWASCYPPGWLWRPDRTSGPLSKEKDALKALKELALPELQALREAEENLHAAEQWIASHR